jgi:hypothetical protein
MDNINYRNKKGGYSQKNQIIVFKVHPGVPNQKKNTRSDDNTENFGKAMKEKIIGGTDPIKAHKGCDPKSGLIPIFHSHLLILPSNNEGVQK